MCILYRTLSLFVVVLRHSNSMSVIYQGDDMMYEMRRKPEPTLLPSQGIFDTI